MSCSSCNSKYLVNSADLKPNGRHVRCATCGYEWFQEATEEINKTTEPFITESKNGDINNNKKYSSNLPSKYVEAEKASFINSFLVIIILAFMIFSSWYIKSESSGIIAIVNYYIQEFYFNLKLIINDLAKLVFRLIN